MRIRGHLLCALTDVGQSALSRPDSLRVAGCFLQSGPPGLSRVCSGVMDRRRRDDCFLEMRHFRIVCAKSWHSGTAHELGAGA